MEGKTGADYIFAVRFRFAKSVLPKYGDFSFKKSPCIKSLSFRSLRDPKPRHLTICSKSSSICVCYAASYYRGAYKVCMIFDVKGVGLDWLQILGLEESKHVVWCIMLQNFAI